MKIIKKKTKHTGTWLRRCRRQKKMYKTLKHDKANEQRYNLTYLKLGSMLAENKA